MQDCILDVTIETLHKFASNMRQSMNACIAEQTDISNTCYKTFKCNYYNRIKILNLFIYLLIVNYI
jgi:hypothetical protein